MATQIVGRNRPESLERWQAALDRAIANGLEVFTVADTGERMVTSASKLDTVHRTDGRHCACEAALAGDPVCQHRAVVRYVMGWLPARETVPAVNCPACAGVGRVEEWGVSGPIGAKPCDACQGTGQHVDRRPQGLPAVRPVATAA
jgi:hypothetical protein